MRICMHIYERALCGHCAGTVWALCGHCAGTVWVSRCEDSASVELFARGEGSNSRDTRFNYVDDRTYCVSRTCCMRRQAQYVWEHALLVDAEIGMGCVFRFPHHNHAELRVGVKFRPFFICFEMVPRVPLE